MNIFSCEFHTYIMNLWCCSLLLGMLVGVMCHIGEMT